MTTPDLTLPPRGRDLRHLSSGRARASAFGILWSFANVSVSTLLTLTVFLVTSRILTPMEFGAVALAVAIVSLVGAIVPSAFGEALVQRPDLREQHTNTVFWLTSVCALCGALGLVLLAGSIADVTGVPLVAEILPVLALRIVFDAGLTVPAALITRRMQFRYIALRTTIANGIGAIICLWMVTHGYALWALVISQITTSFAALIVTFAAAKWWPRLVVSRAALRDLRQFGLYSMGGRILGEAKIDQLTLGLVLGPAALGLYFFARRLFQMLSGLTSGVFSPVTNVLIASLHEDADKRREFYLLACFASASLAFPVFSGLIAVAPTAVPFVFGTQWIDAIFAIQCFSIIGLMAGLGVMQAGLIRYLGNPGWWFWYQTTMQLSTIPIILVLHPFGLDVIMGAVVLRALLLWPFSLLKAQSMLDMSLLKYLKSLRPPAIAALVMTVFVVECPNLFQEAESGTILALQVLIGASLYCAVLAALSFARIRTVYRLLRQETKVKH